MRIWASRGSLVVYGLSTYRLARRFGIGLRRSSRRNLVGVMAGFFLVAIAAGAALADFVAPYDHLAVDYGSLYQPPSGSHVLGTDYLGRDVLSRLMFGARTSLVVAVGAVALGATIGGAIGIMSGFRGGYVDLLIQRIMDAIMSIPLLIVAMSIVLLIGGGLFEVTFAIGILLIPRANRISRGNVLAAKQELYVEAARAIGCSDIRIMAQHLLPAVLPPMLIFVSLSLGGVIMIEAFMSFLGLGVAPPNPSWGGMLSLQAFRHFERAPWLVWAPGVALFGLVLALNLFGDTVRDLIDPKMTT